MKTKTDKRSQDYVAAKAARLGRAAGEAQEAGAICERESPDGSRFGCPKCGSGDWKLAEGGIAYCGRCRHAPPNQTGY